jgi:hypothetical protein
VAVVVTPTEVYLATVEILRSSKKASVEPTSIPSNRYIDGVTNKSSNIQSSPISAGYIIVNDLTIGVGRSWFQHHRCKRCMDPSSRFSSESIRGSTHLTKALSKVDVEVTLCTSFSTSSCFIGPLPVCIVLPR